MTVTLTDFLCEIRSWIQTNSLNLSNDKPNMIHISPKPITKTIHNSSNFPFERHVNDITRTAYVQLKSIAPFPISVTSGPGLLSSRTLLKQHLQLIIQTPAAHLFTHCRACHHSSPSSTNSTIFLFHNRFESNSFSSLTKPHIARTPPGQETSLSLPPPLGDRHYLSSVLFCMYSYLLCLFCSFVIVFLLNVYICSYFILCLLFVSLFFFFKKD